MKGGNPDGICSIPSNEVVLERIATGVEMIEMDLLMCKRGVPGLDFGFIVVHVLRLLCYPEAC